MMDGMDKFMIEEKKKKLASGVNFSNEEFKRSSLPVQEWRK
jgi:hypothetical protein